MDPTAERSWEGFLDPQVLRPRLIAASIFIAAFESLKDAIIGRAREFFWCGFDESGDSIDPAYQANVLSRSKSPVHASLGWLKDMNVIDENDIRAFDRVKACRNVLAHRLFAVIASEGLPESFETCFGEMIALVRKIELWWITEVEIPTNPDFDGAEIKTEDIVPGRVLGMQLLCDIALGDDTTSRSYIETFRKLKSGS